MMLDRMRALPPGRQILFALLCLALLTMVLAGAWFGLREPYRPLFTRLKPIDAAAIVAELDRKKAPYALAENGTTILVPADRVDATRLDIMNDNLALKGSVGFELFNKSDMGLTDFAQRINYQRALQGELERTITTLDGVETARVHLSLGEDRIFREDRVSPKASVTVHMRAGSSLDVPAASGIQRLVAAAVPQLLPSDVVLLDEKGDVIGAGATSDSPVIAAQAGDEGQAVSAFYAARIHSALRPAFGDQIQVLVHAALPVQGETDAEPNAVFNAASRTFPLEITLTPPSVLDTSARQQAEGIAADSIAFSPAKGDTISFGSAVPVENTRARPVTPSTPTTYLPTPSAPPGLADGLPGLYVWSLLAIVTTGACAFALMRGRANVRPLSGEQRQRLAARLRQLIDLEEGPHAPEI